MRATHMACPGSCVELQHTLSIQAACAGQRAGNKSLTKVNSVFQAKRAVEVACKCHVVLTCHVADACAELIVGQSPA